MQNGSPHIQQVVEFATSISRRVKNAVIDDPEFIDVGIDIDTSHEPDAFDYLFGVATPLPTHQFNGKGMVFIKHRIIKENVAIFRENQLFAHHLAQFPWRKFFPLISRLTRSGLKCSLWSAK